MESIDPVWLFGALVLVGGILIGVLLFRLFSPAAGDVAKLEAELEQARSDMESYKASVNTHFNKTSDLVNELTQDYVKVYRHLAEGAQTLSETREFTQVLDQPSGRVLISVEAETEQAKDPLEAQAEQSSATDEAETQGEGSETTASEAVAGVDDTPVDYARANEAADEKVVAESADEVTPGEGDSVSAVDAEQQAVADAVEAERRAVADAVKAKQQAAVDEAETDSTRKT